jgi:prepilin-type N-terminal cleavage/methylation domain-containing protein
MPRPTAPTRAGFTLIEMIVTLIVLAIVSAIILPRLGGNRDREFDLVTDRVADLLMMYAQRESLGRRPIGLWLDAANHRLVLTVVGEDAQAGGRQAAWMLDAFVRPVVLPEDVVVLDVQADGESIDVSQYPLQTEPGENRPSIAIILEGPSEVVTVALASHALAPVKVRGDSYHNYLGGPVDLDAAGRDREDW